MAVKLLIAAESNSGKTTLTKTLEDALVISHDGKKFPFHIPHVMVSDFNSINELIDLINTKIGAYHDKYGKYPSTIVFDSVSKIFDTMLAYNNRKHSGFKIYSELNNDVNEFTSYIQNTIIASDMNVVLISHALYDQDTAKYNLVGKGDFAKRGGFLSEVDQSLFIEVKGQKRILHFRSPKFPARTLRDEDPDSMPIEDFNLQSYITTLASEQTVADEFEL